MNAYLSSVISISLVLLLVGIASMLLVNAKGVSDYFKENMQILSVETQPYNAYGYGEIVQGRGALLLIQSFDNVIHTTSFSDKAKVMSAAYTQIPESKWQSYIERSRAVAGTAKGGIIVRIIYNNSSGETKIIDRLIPNE